MKKFIVVIATSITIIAFNLLLKSCNPLSVPNYDKALKKYFTIQLDSSIVFLEVLKEHVQRKYNANDLKPILANARNYYKKSEALTEYYFQGLAKRINGPALPDVKTEDGQVWPPHGFQVLEQYIYDENIDSIAPEFLNEIELLKLDIAFVKTNIQYQTILPSHVKELVQHQLIRIAALGITGFDTPISFTALAETKYSLQAINEIQFLFSKENAIDITKITNEALTYLDKHTDFEYFDRLSFLVAYLMPLSEAYDKAFASIKDDSDQNKPFSGNLANLLKGQGFNPSVYSSYDKAKTNNHKIALGKQLFYDNQLSANRKISCGSCHNENKFFTDGKDKSSNFVHGGSLLRNTPTLLYASLQSHQFYDLRSVSLEDQIGEVIKNREEFNFNTKAIGDRLLANKNYEQLFLNAFGNKEQDNNFKILNALASYVRSLNPFSSKLDDYFRGDANALNAQEKKGFNLFMGKAKCGSCHFLPVFNGNIPPWFNKSESEIIGIPNKVKWQNATIDADSGRYKINQITELMYAFKTPTIRNIAKTAPYMHNGVYKTLNEVVEFYHKGGGAGLNIELPGQSLPFDSLKLTTNDKAAIVAFMTALTDRKF
jgi:cytochrome c peroxidase